MMQKTGGLIIGLQGTTVTTQERAWLMHPLVVGVILFTRNYESLEQLILLTAKIKMINPKLMISVDHEGGRVQRFREGFSRLPPMGSLRELYAQNMHSALMQAEHYGYVMASELKQVNVDFSYAPVCDIDYGHNTVIGDRAFHNEPDAVAALVMAFYQGIRRAGSIGVAKHFPGHGYVSVDTHLGIGIDERSLDEIERTDLLPFITLIDAGIEGVMPAHIIYTAMDDAHTAVTSRIWLTYLRDVLHFEGAIISDDLDMKGAAHLGSAIEKAQACFDAGIDIILCCNDFAAIEDLLSLTTERVLSEDVRFRCEVMRAHLQD